jgi:hypothetical protein
MKRAACMAIAGIMGLMCVGCADMARGVARLHGYDGDALPGPCAPESLQIGKCVPEKTTQQKGPMR